LAIKSGQDYDTRVQIVLDLDRDLLFRIMVRAHEQDITLNQMIEKILQETINFESSSI
jgi:predicted HicB family RNase H-like nuclease